MAGGSPQAAVPGRSRGRAGRDAGAAAVSRAGSDREPSGAVVVKAQGDPSLQTCGCQHGSPPPLGLGRGHRAVGPSFSQSRGRLGRLSPSPLRLAYL